MKEFLSRLQRRISRATESTSSVTVNGQTFSSTGSIVVKDGNVVCGGDVVISDNGIGGEILPGSGASSTERRILKPFDGVVNSILGTVKIYVGEDPVQEHPGLPSAPTTGGRAYRQAAPDPPDSSYSVDITADDNLLEKIETEVVGGVLTLRMKSSAAPRTKISLRITTRSLKDIKHSGVGDLYAHNINTPQQLSLEHQGTGTMSVDGNAAGIEANISGCGVTTLEGFENIDTFDLYQSGASTLKMSGSVRAVHASVSGVSETLLSALKAQHINLNVSGTATLRLDAKHVTGTLSGAAEVYMTGSRASVTWNVETAIAAEVYFGRPASDIWTVL